jgi:hypothetical protein
MAVAAEVRDPDVVAPDHHDVRFAVRHQIPFENADGHSPAVHRQGRITPGGVIPGRLILDTSSSTG